MTTMTHDVDFDLDRFLRYLENLRLNRPRAAAERTEPSGALVSPAQDGNVESRAV